MLRSTVAAVNAIELAPDDANVSPLRKYCIEECGLTEETLQKLIDTKGPTDQGKVAVALKQQNYVPEKPKKKAKKRAKKKA